MINGTLNCASLSFTFSIFFFFELVNKFSPYHFSILLKIKWIEDSSNSRTKTG